MKILIKVGGALLDTPEGRQQIAAQIARVADQHRVAVVHGGGKQVTRYLEERGVKSNFVDGFRVSDDAVVDAVIKNIAGTVNKQFVSTLSVAGVRAVGISGIDGPLTIAEQWDPRLGAVGKPVKTDARVLDALVFAGFTPVIACIAGGAEGQIFNVNADQMAASCAIAWNAELLIFLTDVPGVKDSSGQVLETLTPTDIRGLIEDGTAHGGMQAKLEAALLALNSSREVRIAAGSDPAVLERVVAGDAFGTKLVHR